MDRQDKARAAKYLAEIRRLADQPLKIMEVCGTHTVAIAKNALRDVLPPQIRLISGPGCPVCVTDQSDIDRFLFLAAQPDIITATFGDMIRVPGTSKSLQALRSEGADIRVVYSTLDALALARKNPAKEVVFLGVGFETTAPTVAVSLQIARQENLKNFSVLVFHKLVPPALRALAEDPLLEVDAFLDPGHACAIIGIHPLEFMARQYGKPGVVTGFEALDILEAILMILRQRVQGRTEIEIQYKKVVKAEGNVQAQALITEVFAPADAFWRGLGCIPQSGLAIRPAYRSWDAAVKFNLPLFQSVAPQHCRCGDILKGRIRPGACSLFGSECTPLQPIGPCMVSSEGTCAAYYRYNIQ
jgi:hydrogenase expression/formation protein HypD